MRYLEREGRSKSFDCSPLFQTRKGSWASDFDLVRDAYGKDDGGRKYYHFVISPDPKDGVDLGLARRLAVEWAQARYPDGQWVVETHDDNGIPHAHVVLNSVMPLTGKKVHMSNARSREDALELQRLCKHHGISAFDTFSIEQTDEGEWVAKDSVPVSDTERRRREAKERARARSRSQSWMREKGVHLWTDDMREAIETALDGCATWRAFERELAKAGYSMRVSKRGVLTFYPPEGRGHPCKGYKLDDSFTVEGLKARLVPNLGRGAGAGLLCNTPSKVVVMPTRFAEIAGSQTRRTARRREAEGRLVGYLDAIAVIKANGYTSLRQIAEAVEETRGRAEEVSARLAEAQLVFEQAESASQNILVLEALRNRVGAAPRNPLFAKRWRDSNAEELRQISEIEDWLAARGLASDVTLEEMRGRRSDAYAIAASLAAEASRLVEEAEKIGNAYEALAGVPLPYGAEERGRQAEAGCARAPRLARTMTAEAYAEYARRQLERSRSLGKLLVEGALSRQNAALLAATVESGRAAEEERPSFGRGARERDLPHAGLRATGSAPRAKSDGRAARREWETARGPRI